MGLKKSRLNGVHGMRFNLSLKRNGRISLAILLILILLLTPVSAILDTVNDDIIVVEEKQDNGDYESQQIRSSRQPNTDNNGNDGFSTASIIQYSVSGNTFVNTASVGGSSDTVD